MDYTAVDTPEMEANIFQGYMEISRYKGHVYPRYGELIIDFPTTGEITGGDFIKLFSIDGNPKPAFGFPAFENWFDRLLSNLALQDNEAHPFHKHPYKLREIEVQAVDWFHADKLGFMKIQAKIETDAYIHEGEDKARADWLPGAVFLRGGSVAVLVSYC